MQKEISNNDVEKILQLISSLKRPEKASVLQWIVQDMSDAFVGIDSIPDVCGGEPCIVRTRIPVWLLVRAKQLGKTDGELLQCYPALRAEDLANAWAYFRSHRAEIQRQINENELA